MNYVKPNEKVINTSVVERRTQYTDTVLDQPLQTRTLTESFIAQLNKQNQSVYIARYFVADLEGGVYVIETRTSARNGHKYVGVSKEVFDSFRMLLPQ